MHLRFLRRAFGPHAVWLAAVAAVMWLRPGDHWQAWAGVLLAGLLAWFVTDRLVTGRTDGDRIFKPIRTGRPAGEPQWVPEYWSWLIALFPCAIVAALFSIAVTTGRPHLFAVGAAVDAAVVILALFLTDGYGSFCRNVRPALERAVAEARQQAKTQATLSARAAAKAEALRYYEQNRDLLADTVPPALFLATLEAAIPQHAEAKDAYAAVKNLIGTLQPVVAQGRERQRQEREEAERERRQREKRVRELRQQAQDIEQLIEQLRRSPGDPDVAAAEIETRERDLRELKRQIDDLNTPEGSLR